MSDMYFEDYRPNPKDLLDDYMEDTMDVDDTEEVLHEFEDDIPDTEVYSDDYLDDDIVDIDDVQEVLRELTNLE